MQITCHKFRTLEFRQLSKHKLLSAQLLTLLCFDSYYSRNYFVPSIITAKTRLPSNMTALARDISRMKCKFQEKIYFCNVSAKYLSFV